MSKIRFTKEKIHSWTDQEEFVEEVLEGEEAAEYAKGLEVR